MAWASDPHHLQRTQSPPLWVRGPTVSSTIPSASLAREDDVLEKEQSLHSSSQNKPPAAVGASFSMVELPTTASAAPGRRSTVEHDQSFLARSTKWQLLSACVMNFGNGMNDSAPGALIPYLERDYDIGYAIVSMIVISNALGFIFAAPFTHAIELKIGRWKSYALSMTLLIAGYTTIICYPPFPIVAIAFFFLGFAMALTLTLNNVFCANLPISTTALGTFGGAYGIGGVVSPLIATAMISWGARWCDFYAIPLGMAVVNLVFSAWAFFNFDGNLYVDSRLIPEEPSSSTNNDGPPSRIDLLTSPQSPKPNPPQPAPTRKWAGL
ncbi:hypothetical protein N7457_006368 [Penicillium paradoxum]|uniref:uncharacterized protein n=1 Tax=Penicillium paradoxum TaxID=176176 RepID=UPI002547B614|nr:uncharacterized protein N7457_006368 [Penicillium paradoxum]KAJ5781208.1 hypothetical protein N7457_006368 [Penicillium paradoxum]